MFHINPEKDFSPELRAALCRADKILSTLETKTAHARRFLSTNYYNHHITLERYIDIVNSFLSRLETITPILEEQNPINQNQNH